jgi:cytochrome c biogenesis protein
LKLSNPVWKFFVSVRLTVVLLISLAATSIIGTVIPQNQDHAAYFHEYGENLYKLLFHLDIFDMYNAWWFRLLILMLSINIIICSIDRLSSVWKVIFNKNPGFSVKQFKKIQEKEKFLSNTAADNLSNIYTPVIARAFGFVKVENTEKGICIFAEKHRWTRIGVYIVHASVLLLLAGALAGSILGFEGFVNIPEGETVNSIKLIKSGGEISLDFEIKCEDFEVTHYENGAPKEYRSSLTILEKGRTVLKKDIIVNDPLRYRGINIFQSSYGTLSQSVDDSGKNPEEIVLVFTSRASGMAYEKNVKFGEPVDIPEETGKFIVSEYKKSAEFRGHNIGEALVGKYIADPNSPPVEVLLPLKFPGFDRMRGGNMVISVQERYYTGLQVTKDPGVWIVYSGFILMIAGFFITFFMSHQRICVEIIKGGKKTSVTVSGISNKNRFAMENRIKKLSGKLQRLAGQEVRDE